MKIGKEEMIGLLAAVEMWVQRDHKKEDEMWTQWMQTIADRVGKVDGVTAMVRQPRGLGNHSPGLTINWDPARLGITGEEVSNILWTTEPRIALGGGGGRGGRGATDQTGISITAYMMMPEDVKVVADRVYEILAAKRPAWKPEPPKPPTADLTGRWDVRIEFAAGTSEHTLHVRQQGNQLAGTHQGDFVSRDFSGTISGGDVRISSSIGEIHGAALSYRFSGKLEGDKMSGSLDMGEYLGAKWTATRHAFGRGGDQG
jgi:L-seryl-tRNA(Ser) seleniumtransferase